MVTDFFQILFPCNWCNYNWKFMLINIYKNTFVYCSEFFFFKKKNALKALEKPNFARRSSWISLLLNPKAEGKKRSYVSDLNNVPKC